MKRVTWVAWVLLVTSTLLSAKDWGSPQAQEYRRIECEKLALDMSRSAFDLEQRATKTEDADSRKLLSELAKLKKDESENFSKLAEAIRKKQWSTITRLEKKGGELCEESSEKWKKLEKKEEQLAKAKPPKSELKKPFMPPPTKPQAPGEKSPDSVYPKTNETVQPTATPLPAAH